MEFLWYFAQSYNGIRVVHFYKIMFSGKKFVGLKMSPKWICRFCQKSMNRAVVFFCLVLLLFLGFVFVFVFLLEVTSIQRLKFDSAAIFWQKVAQNKFFKSYKESLYWIFLIYMKLQQHKGWKLGEIVMTKFLFQSFWGKKARKSSRN